MEWAAHIEGLGPVVALAGPLPDGVIIHIGDRMGIAFAGECISSRIRGLDARRGTPPNRFHLILDRGIDLSAVPPGADVLLELPPNTALHTEPPNVAK